MMDGDISVGIDCGCCLFMYNVILHLFFLAEFHYSKKKKKKKKKKRSDHFFKRKKGIVVSPS
jgi:hypothetical protein